MLHYPYANLVPTPANFSFNHNSHCNHDCMNSSYPSVVISTQCTSRYTTCYDVLWQNANRKHREQSKQIQNFQKELSLPCHGTWCSEGDNKITRYSRCTCSFQRKSMKLLPSPHGNSFQGVLSFDVFSEKRGARFSAEVPCRDGARTVARCEECSKQPM